MSAVTVPIQKAASRLRRSHAVASVVVPLALAGLLNVFHRTWEIWALTLLSVVALLLVGAVARPKDPDRQRRIRRFRTLLFANMSEGGVSPERLAKAAGLKRAELDDIIEGKVMATSEQCVAIARALDQPVLRYLEALEYIPLGVRHRLLRLEASASWLNDIFDAKQRAERLGALKGITPGGLLAGALAAVASREEDVAPGWSELDVLVRPVLRGNRWKMMFHDYVSIAPARPEAVIPDRQEITKAISDDWKRTGSEWEDSQTLLQWMAPERPRNLVVTVPRLLAVTPPDERPTRGLDVKSIVVIGTWWSGAPDIGALVADALGWGFTSLATLTREVFGDLDRDEAVHRQWDIAQEFLASPDQVGRRVVLAIDDVDLIEANTGALAESLSNSKDVALVHACYGPSLAEYAAHQFARVSRDEGQRHAPLDWVALEPSVDAARQRLARLRASLDRELMRQPSERLLVLHSDAPERQPGGDEWPDEVDALFDVYADGAVETLRWLHRRHGGPDVNGWRGEFGRQARSNANRA